MLKLLLVLSLQGFTSDCTDYSVRCECFPAVPFEGFQIYVVETCNGEETWGKYFNTPQFEDAVSCEEGLKLDKNCAKLAH